jgi:hypothetical protein
MKNTQTLEGKRLRRFSHPSPFNVPQKYASWFRISRALHLDIYDQRVETTSS